ncbi:hypothetical protein BD626DRAFT_577206 [Schizophyllum amplum]|uniref:F-box domain-containing protein n=1 Tax=Schizophyllum amplum TaxID=97359 RepID=A0A550BSR9_9AGAR|nr:hypothetical protein BD626DRAFT_577206 [Auriculariopsis ampla]
MLDSQELRLEVFRCLWITQVRPLRLVCKAWYPEADQAMWELIETLPPLLRFLPEDAWEEDVGSRRLGRGKVYTWPKNFNIIRPLQPEDWSETMMRARYVKSYRIHQALSNCTDATLEAIVACPPPRIPLLTGAHSVTLEPPSSQLALYGKLLHLLIPHQYITAMNCVAVEEFVPDLDSFIPRFQNLESLTLHVAAGRHAREDSYPVTTRDASQRYDIRFVKALERCSKLQHLDLTLHARVTIHMLRTLSENSTLRSLTLRYGGQDVHQFEQALSAAYSFPAFPSVRRLEIKGLSLRAASRLFTSRTLTPLEDIYVIDDRHDVYIDEDEERSSPAKDALLNTLRLIGSHLEPYHSLRVLYIQGPSYHEFSLTLGDLRPLAAFHNMREITIAIEHATVLVDADCDQMADWWPNLEVFALSYECREGDTRCTLRGLVALASRCPRLAVLQLPLDAMSIPDIQTEPGRAPPPYTSLKELRIGNALRADTEALVQFIKTIFPNLRHLEYAS